MYDIIVHLFTSLVPQIVGVPTPIISTIFLAIQSMKFHIRTSFDNSSSTYHSDTSKPLKGLCQGNSSSLTGQIVDSSVIIQTLSKENLEFVAPMFVDDTNFPALVLNEKDQIKKSFRQDINLVFINGQAA